MNLDSESDQIRVSRGHFMLVLGGARSGKSRYAETVITSRPRPWIYLATAEPLDAEMETRIAEHRQRRGTRWHTIEAPRDLGGALRGVPHEASVLIDCLTLWLSNLLIAEADLKSEIDRVESALAEMRGLVVAVANEVGCGIVPENALARRFRDAAGQLNQRLAARAERVVLVVAGIPVNVK
jgi:adenosylcobinamide kinase / adenosylcobinamide-phosphate guanylyltransferase